MAGAYGINSTISQGDYFSPTLGDRWMGGLSDEAGRMNAGQAAGRSGGGPSGGTPWTGIDYQKTALDLQKQALASKNAHWNAAFGALQGMIGGGDGFATAGGQSGPGPAISAGPIWNPQQIDQQVNASRAQNDARSASQQRSLQSSTSGRGFGSNSPLLAALQTGVQNANTATNTESERAFRQQAAEGNAGQVLKGQQAQEQQFSARQNEDIERRKPYFQRQNALIAALAGLA